MPLWDRDCPFWALAAPASLSPAGGWAGPHLLALLSPLFCEQAWQCLRLGLALRLVGIPQSGLLAQVSSLRLPSQHSGLVLILSNTASSSLSHPHLLVGDVSLWAAALLGTV